MDSQDLEQGQEEKAVLSSSVSDGENVVDEAGTAAGVSLLFGASVEGDGESEEVVEEGSASGKEERLAKFLASAGIASRRNCEELIQEGRVTVNGEPVVSPAYNVDPEKDHVCFEGRPVESYPQGKVYILLNKPVGYTCSAKDDHAEKLVFELIPQRFGRLFTVGRLDRDSEGMLILTNDGEYAQRVMHPSRQIVKRYYVECDGQFTTSLRRRMIEGFYDNDEFLRALNVEEVNVSRGHCTLIFTLGEGRKREVRRLCKDVGLQVTLLRRIAIGALEMDDKLSAGSWRMLSEAEQQKVFEKVRLPEQAAAVDPKPYWQKEKKPFDREHRPYAASPFPEYRKREEDSTDSRDRKPFGRKPFDRDRKPFDRDRKPFDRDRKPFEAEERRPWYAEDGESQQPREERSFDRKPFDRERKPFDRDRKPFDRDRKPFDRDRKPYGDRDRKPYGDRDRKPFDRDRKPYGDRDRKPFGRDGERSERGGHGGFGRGAQGFRGGAHGSRPPRSWR